MTQLQANPFEPASIYSAPQMMISQVLEGEATLSSLWNTMVAPNNLTPQQRETVFQQLKGKFGNNPVAGTLIDAISNPWVWLAFLTTPGGPTALKGGGRLFGNAYTAFVGGKSEMALFFQTAAQAYEGTPLPTIMRKLGDLIKDQKLLEARITHQATADVIKAINQKHGWKIKSLDWRDTRNPHAKRFLEKLEATLYANAEGLDKAVTSVRSEFGPRFYKLKASGDQVSRGEEIIDPEELKRVFEVWKRDRARPGPMEMLNADGSTKFKFEAGAYDDVGGQLIRYESKRRKLVKSDTMKVLEEMGPEVVAYRNAIEAAKQVRFSQLYLRDTMSGRYTEEVLAALDKGVKPPTLKEWGLRTDQLEKYIDTRKVERMWRALKNNDLVGRAVSGVEEYENYSSIAAMMSRDMRAAILADKDGGRVVTRKMFAGWVNELVKDSVNLDNFMPRNTVQMLKVRGGKLVPAKEYELQKAMERNLLTASQRQQLRVTDKVRWEAESLERMGRHLEMNRPVYKDELNEAHRVTKGGAFDRFRYIDNYIPARQMDYWAAMDRYFSTTGRDYAMFVARVPEEVAREQEMWLPRAQVASETDKWARAYWADAKPVSFKQAMRYDRDPRKMPPGGWSMADAVQQSARLLPLDTKGQQAAATLLADAFLPTVLGTMHHEYGLTKMAMRLGQQGLGRLLESPLGPMLKEGKKTEPIYDALRYWADVDVDRVAAKFLRGAAGHLYTTHLGVPNFGSVVLNLTQPWHLAAGRMGAGPVMGAYMDALGEMGGYIGERLAKYGFKPISKETRRNLYKKHFEFADEMGVQGHILEDIEKITFEGMDATEGPALYAYRALLKPFEKAELLNRSVTAHAVKRMYRAAGRMPERTLASGRANPAYQAFLRDVEEMTARTQFGSSEMNTPALFIHRKSILNNPLARMFLTFPVRTSTEAFALGGRLGPTRRLAGMVDVPWWAGDWMRMLGISSVIQNIGTNWLHTDLRRYGAWSAATDIVRPSLRPVEQDNPLPLPPFMQIPWDVARGWIGGDWPVMWNGIMRTVPGGVGLFKMAQSAPRLPAQLKNMQRTYVDWTNPDEAGRVPVFKGSGELIEYRDPLSLVLASFGVSMETHKKGAMLDGYMVQQREEINRRKNEMLRAVGANNWGRAQQIRAQFQKEFGYPLVVTQQQVKSYIRSRTVPRTERMLDQMPTFARPDYARLVASNGVERLGLDEAQFRGGFTANARRPVADRHQTVTIDIDELKRLGALVSQAEARTNITGNPGFVPPTGYLDGP